MTQTMFPARDDRDARRDALRDARRGERTTRHDVHALVQRHVDEVVRRLGLRPGVNVEWPARARVTPAVAGAITDALEESLGRLADHEGLTSAFVSVSWRDETVEVCVVHDGRAPASRVHPPVAHLDEATGVERDIDDYGPVGTCQWWSIPTDL
jgi:hypothetical protein